MSNEYLVTWGLESGEVANIIGQRLSATDADLSEDDLSLREAIEIANRNQLTKDTIRFDPSLSDGTVRLSLGKLLTSGSLEIKGLGADKITNDRGGAVFNDLGSMYIANATIVENRADNDDDAFVLHRLSGMGGGNADAGSNQFRHDLDGQLLTLDQRYAAQFPTKKTLGQNMSIQPC